MRWSEIKQIYYIRNVHPLEVVGGGNETQLQVGTNLFFYPFQRGDSLYTSKSDARTERIEIFLTAVDP